MTVSELISRLQELDGNKEIQIGVQPNYPMLTDLVGIWVDESGTGYDDVYLITNGNKEYFTSEAFENCY